MIIKEGKNYFCKKSVKTLEEIFSEGKVYMSECDGYLTCNNGRSIFIGDLLSDLFEDINDRENASKGEFTYDIPTTWRFSPPIDNTLGIKESQGKLKYELDFDFITQMAERMDANKGKYEPYNWMKPIDTKVLHEALARHFFQIMRGNYEDEGREFGHLEALALNVMMINYQLKNIKND